MQIESIVSKRNLVVISINDGRTFEVDVDFVVSLGLRKNDEVSDVLLEKLNSRAEFIAVKENALRYISRRPHSRKELFLKLLTKKFRVEVIEQVITELENRGFVDETAFAAQFISEKISRRKDGPLKIRAALMDKGIDREIIDENLNRLAGENILFENALETARRKIELLAKTGKSGYEIITKLKTFLFSKGYSGEIISRVITELKL